MPFGIEIRSAESSVRPGRSDPRPGKPRSRRGVEPAARVPVRPAHRWYLPWKAVADTVIALVLAVPALPVVLLAALLVKLSSRGPAFYTQTRLGRRGRPFTIYKVRTMIHNCESLTGPRWSIPGDPRITWVGHFLRKAHIDELPQLLNVLRGDMSLIGPRPERPEFVPELAAAFPCYHERLNVRPGVTGLAQLQLPPDTDLESVRRKLMYDLYYVQRVGPWLDLRILLGTVLYALGIRFAVGQRLFRIPGGAAVERQMQALVVEAPTPRQRLSA